MRLRPKVKALLPKIAEAMGRTKGGLNTKIHALVNVRSQALVIAKLPAAGRSPRVD